MGELIEDIKWRIHSKKKDTFEWVAVIVVVVFATAVVLAPALEFAANTAAIIGRRFWG